MSVVPIHTAVRRQYRTHPFHHLAIPMHMVEWMPAVGPDAFCVWLFIWRKTYGFKKQTDAISEAQIVAGTGCSRSTVQRCVRILEQSGLIRVVRNRRKSSVFEALYPRFASVTQTPVDP